MTKEKHRSFSILLVVAHPDDESLWFYEGLKFLSKIHKIEILCLTYSADSPRGQELQMAIRDLNVKLSFAEIEDSGFSNYLPNLARKLETVLDSGSKGQQFDLAITHPFHGGEKPHPHHIQAFYTLAGLCLKRGLLFGFFCEQELKTTDSKSCFVLSKKWWLYSMAPYLWKMFRNISSQRYLYRDFCYNVKNLVLFLFSSSPKFDIISFRVRGDDKKRALSQHRSQLIYLSGYHSINNQLEFLYIPQSITMTLVNENIGLNSKHSINVS
ncbi:MAG: GlcNAc-PI de-N-acetylase [Pseudomonadota bacterium]